ncbi:MAG: arsenate reductase ArsC [Flavobacteriales bacterium]
MSKLNLLFVCIENSNRSQMAQAFAKIVGSDNVLALSAGSAPSGRVNPKAIEAMKELGYDLSSHESKSVNDLPDVEFDYVVSMGCGDKCPWVPAKQRLDWEIPDPRNMDEDEFRQVRDLIGEKVRKLISDQL